MNKLSSFFSVYKKRALLHAQNADLSDTLADSPTPITIVVLEQRCPRGRSNYFFFFSFRQEFLI